MLITLFQKKKKFRKKKPATPKKTLQLIRNLLFQTKRQIILLFDFESTEQSIILVLVQFAFFFLVSKIQVAQRNLNAGNKRLP